MNPVSLSFSYSGAALIPSEGLLAAEVESVVEVDDDDDDEDEC